MAKLRRAVASSSIDADVKVFGAPPVPGLSVASGYKIMIEDRGGLGLEALQSQTDAVVAKLQSNPTVIGTLTQFRSRTPQLYLDIDRTKAESLGVNVNDVNQTMQIYLGSLYAGEFNAFGRDWQVNVQAEEQFRDRTEAVGLLQVQVRTGENGSTRYIGEIARGCRPSFGQSVQPARRSSGNRERSARREFRRGGSRPSTRPPPPKRFPARWERSGPS